MTKSITAFATLCLAAGHASAGALDRTGQSVDVLFEEGRYAEFSYSLVSPDLTGISITALGGNASGDISPTYGIFSGAYKADLNDRFSYAFIIDQPFNAEVDYADGTGYFAQGSSAEFESIALTGILQYNMPSGMSVYGGLRLQQAGASSTIGFVSNYSNGGAADLGLGYVAGVAYERPEIALRVSLTYNSEVAHRNDTIEYSDALGGPNQSVTEIETPQSVNLAFQTGIAADTLLFGGVRWVDWSDFDITPANYQLLTSGRSLLSYDDDVFTYTLGLGRKLNETWSVAASLGYEETTGSFFTNLGPSDGQESISLAAIYTRDKLTITTGVRYVNIGNTQTRVGSFEPGAFFDDNDAVAIGVKIGYNF